MYVVLNKLPYLEKVVSFNFLHSKTYLRKTVKLTDCVVVFWKI